MNTEQWIKKISGDATRNAVASKADIYPATLNRQLERGELSAEVAIKISRAYGYSPVQALVDLGILEPSEVEGGVRVIDVSGLTDAELAWELLNRTDDQGLLSRPLDSEAVEELSEANVTIFQAAKETYPPGKEIE